MSNINLKFDREAVEALRKLDWFHRLERHQQNGLTSLIAGMCESAARVSPGHVRTEDGVERKVLGTLPVTADGCVAGKGAHLHPLHPIDLGDGDDDYCTLELAFYVTPPEGGRLDEDDEAQINTCYSTREAALKGPTP